MGRLAFALGLAAGVLAGCGGSGGSPGVERTLSAAGSGSETVSPEAATATTPATPAPEVDTTVVVRPRATASAAPRGTVAAGAAPATGGYSPPPPPPGVQPDGYNGYGGVSTVTAEGTTVTLRVYPREQYMGERVQVGVEVAGTTAVRAIRIDLGDGTVVDSPQTYAWNCPASSRPLGAGVPAHVYPAPGVYRITVAVTAVPCQILPGPPGGWTGPDGQPAVGMPLPWAPAGPDQALSVSIAVNQRSDRPPPPVGAPPGQ